NRRLSKENTLLFQEEINSSLEIASTFYNHLKVALPEELFKKIYIYYLCDQAKIEITLVKVIRKTLSNRDYWRDITAEDSHRLYQVEREFWRENHRYKGILRFYESQDGVLFAIMEPKYNILPILYKHFVRRFPRERFYILDKRRNILFKYTQMRPELLWVDEVLINEMPLKDEYVEYWKKFFSEIAVPERISFERQRNKLPLRVRKYMTEFV
ncbi:MAG: TIGR03915 family putative DNA repair protein, partial [Candidatus Kryptonium sp.]